MSYILSEIGAALAMAFDMGWEILWPLVLGFALSAIVQAVVTKGDEFCCDPDRKKGNRENNSAPCSLLRVFTRPRARRAILGAKAERPVSASKAVVCRQ
jgi:hypothetical protein